MRIYLAGPMRDYPDFNFPAFDAASAELRTRGHEVFSPADHDRSKHGSDFGVGTSGDHAEVPSFSIRDAMRDDLRWICERADAVVVLNGWEGSKGATAEVATALAIGAPVHPLEEFLSL